MCRRRRCPPRVSPRAVYRRLGIRAPSAQHRQRIRPPTTPPVALHVASSGMAAWTVALIALSSAALAVLATELWHAYRGHRDIAHRTATV